MRDAGQQQLAGGRRNAQILQLALIAEQRQVVLVRIQRVGLRVRRDQDGALQIGLAQRCVGGIIEGEVGQAVVDQIDGQFAMPELPALEAEFAGIGDHRLPAMALEQLLEQQEFRVEVLPLGRLVDDSDAAQRPLMAGAQPLAAEHRHDPRLQLLGARRGRQQLLDGRAAGPLGPGDHGVEHRPAGVGVDLDEAEATFFNMEIEAEEHPFGAAGIVAGDGRSVGQHHFAVGRQGHHRLDGLHHLGHALQLGWCDEDRVGGEQMRAALPDQLEQSRQAEGRFQRRAQLGAVQADAEAAVVERLDGNPGQGGERCGRGGQGLAAIQQGGELPGHADLHLESRLALLWRGRAGSERPASCPRLNAP
ncbi:hypothetical protein D3C85_955870 [compost metagenome]